MQTETPQLYGITHSNRDFSQADAWGKNQFNSSFPVGLANFLASKNLENIYLCIDENFKVKHSFLATKNLYGVDFDASDLFFSFETPYTPYQQLLIGTLPRVDLVTQLKSNGQCLRPIEIKLTALPDNSTCHLEDAYFGSELVIRPDTIVYLACSIVKHFKENKEILAQLIGNQFNHIDNWTHGINVWSYISDMILAIDRIILSILDKQEPLLMQPIWKTIGKSPNLSENCLDVFVWSNFAFAQLFIDVARGELAENANKITRQIRTIIWLFKMLYDFGKKGQFNHHKIIDELSFNTKNDKAFAVNGRITHKYMACPQLEKPRIGQQNIKQIILGGGQHLLSPERRFDAIIYNSPNLFDK